MHLYWEEVRLRGVICRTVHPCNAWFDRPSLRDDAIKPFLEAARWLPLYIHPFVSIAQVFYAGIAADDDNRYTHVIIIHTPY